MSAGPTVPTADDALAASVAAAQAALARACEAGAVRNDPYRLVLAGLSDTMGTLLQTTRRWEAATAAVVAARQGPSPEAEAALVQRVEQRVASVVAHNMTRAAWEMRKRTVLNVAGGAAVALLVTAGGACWWGRASATTSVFIAPGTLVAACRGDAVRVVDGTPLCAVWVRMDEVAALAPAASAGRR